ncbi:MAG: DNA replication and repair protein RecF [Verrucomicrobia bacterium]|nr:MAG: DNA replication and repair protein RecF [Verrucomicrobiota bacterium]
MLLKSIHLQNFRNMGLAALEFDGSSQFLFGLNGQGKTNLLEGISLLTALRSFRTQEAKTLIQHGKTEAQLLYKIEHEREGELEILLKLKNQEKELYVHGNKVDKFSEFIGMIPTVVLSSEDMQLLRGAPSLRRKFIDLSLSAMDADYFRDLRRYHRALLERNALLRQISSRSMVEVYNTILAPLAFNIYQKRIKTIELLRLYLMESYSEMVQEDEEPEIIYRPDCILNSKENFLEILGKGFERDSLLKATQNGPHRDDLEFKMKSKGARQYASEGQQRGLVMALRLAQIKYFHHCTGLKPIVLADDVLGQLDPIRSEAFWRTLDTNFQVVGTGTTLPSGMSGREWQIFKVLEGSFNLDRIRV